MRVFGLERNYRIFQQKRNEPGNLTRLIIEAAYCRGAYEEQTSIKNGPVKFLSLVEFLFTCGNIG